MDDIPVAAYVEASSPSRLAIFFLKGPCTCEKLTPAFSIIDPFCITQVNPEPISFSQASSVNRPVPSACSSVLQMVCCIALYLAAVWLTFTVVWFMVWSVVVIVFTLLNCNVLFAWIPMNDH